MKQRSVLLVTLLALLGCGVFVLLWTYTAPEGPRVRIGRAVFSVEVADTEPIRERGLGYRDTLCATCGMLFVFDHPDTYAFWMKGMRFPLDMLWIRDGSIVHIERSVDFHDQRAVYAPGQPADQVLELNAGACEQKGIREGDMVLFER